MTPEERWTKIENAIAENNRQIAENWHQIQENNRQIAGNSQEIAENNRQIAENSRQIAGTDRQIMRMSAQWETKTTQIDAQIEKNTAAIRDLIVVNRSVIESQKQLHTEINADIERLIKAVEAFLK